MTSNPEKQGPRWWIQVDFTVITVVIVLAIAAYFIKQEYDKSVERDAAAAEKARLERDEREREVEAKLAQREKERRADEQERKKEWAEKVEAEKKAREAAKAKALEPASERPAAAPPPAPDMTWRSEDPKPTARAGTGGDRALSEQGKLLLKESQSHPESLVAAAKLFAQAAELHERNGDEAAATEANSFLYWCKKKMNLAQIQAFTQKEGAASSVAQRLERVTKVVPAEQARQYLERAEAFARQNPKDHLLIAIRYYEVADRFKGTDVSFTAQDRSLKEMQLAATAATNRPPPPPPSPPPAVPIAATPPENRPAPPASAPTQPDGPTAREKVEEAAKLALGDVYKAYMAARDEATAKIQAQEPQVRAASNVTYRDLYGRVYTRFSQETYNTLYGNLVNQHRPALDPLWRKAEIKRDAFLSPYRAAVRDKQTPESRRELQMVLEVMEQYKKQH